MESLAAEPVQNLEHILDADRRSRDVAQNHIVKTGNL